jgi:hypothetical protein
MYEGAVQQNLANVVELGEGRHAQPADLEGECLWIFLK